MVKVFDKDGIQITVKIDDNSKHLPRKALGYQRTPKSWKFWFRDFKIDLKCIPNLKYFFKPSLFCKQFSRLFFYVNSKKSVESPLK